MGKLNLSLKVIEKESENLDLNREQRRRLVEQNGKIEQINNLLKIVDDRLKFDPFILGNNFDTYINRSMKELENDISEFNSLVVGLEKPIKVQ